MEILGVMAIPLVALIAFTIYYFATENKEQKFSVMPKLA